MRLNLAVGQYDHSLQIKMFGLSITCVLMAGVLTGCKPPFWTPFSYSNHLTLPSNEHLLIEAVEESKICHARNYSIFTVKCKELFITKGIYF